MTNRRRQWFWWTAAGVLLCSELFVFLRTLPEKSRWKDVPLLTLNLAAESPGNAAASESSDGRYHYVDQPERLGGGVEQLSYSHGRCGVVRPDENSEDGQRALDFFYLEYEAGNPRFIHDVFGHAPEACMRSTGATLKREHPSRTITIGGRSLKVLVLEFVSPVSSGPFWVFRLTWLPEGTPYDPYESAYTMREEKFVSGILGRPKPPARVLLAGAMGYESLDAAWSSYENLLVSRLKVMPPTT